LATFIHKNLTGADAVHPAAFVQSSDPGTVGANLLWIDTSGSPPTLKVRNTGNTAWVLFAAGAAGATGATGAAGPAGPIGATGTSVITGAAPYLCIQDRKTAPSDGGSITAGAWTTRTLNTIVANDRVIVTLANNQLTLPAGTYRCAISCPAFATATNVTRLQNVTDTATLLRGTVEYGVPSGAGGTCRSVIVGRFFLQSQKTLEIDHWANSTKLTSGLGLGSSTGGAVDGGLDIYTNAEFWLEGPPPPFMGATFDNPGLDTLAGRALQADLAGYQHSLNTPPQ